MQFLGNKYVHGGQSLVTGTDCSGFTSLIYKEFGYSLSRTPSGQLSGAGRTISYSEAQPGDIICYGSNGKCTHVALYIGNGQIIHSANSKKGVVIYNADYDTILGVKNIID
jgi:cell wall-associated NlpC family hydrolase